MVRRTALVLVLALTALSARQLTCVWECSEPSSESPGTPCHETAADGPILAASAGHCPLAPDAAIIGAAKSEPQRQRVTVPFDKIASALPALGHDTTVHRLPARSPRQALTSHSRPLAVLRI